MSPPPTCLAGKTWHGASGRCVLCSHLLFVVPARVRRGKGWIMRGQNGYTVGCLLDVPTLEEGRPQDRELDMAMAETGRFALEYTKGRRLPLPKPTMKLVRGIVSNARRSATLRLSPAMALV
jgi:hypothetical protein